VPEQLFECEKLLFTVRLMTINRSEVKFMMMKICSAPFTFEVDKISDDAL